MRATALVVDAEPPVVNASRWGSESKGTVAILVESGPEGPIYVARSLRLAEDRWLVPGMEVMVSIDPADPERFEVEWDAVPSIEERVAANDPTLAEPSAARRRVAAALESAGVSGPAPGVSRRGIGGGVVAFGGPGDKAPDRLEEAVREAAQKPAPPGKQRAVVVVATALASADSGGGEAFDRSTVAPI